MKVVDENGFQFSIPPLLGLHLVFNVELFRPCSPPLLDTLEVDEHLAPTKRTPNCIEQDTMDCVMDTMMNGTYQQNIQLYKVVKTRQLHHQGKWLTRSHIQQKFPHMMEELNAMATISS
jgi:hypothetical protein